MGCPRVTINSCMHANFNSSSSASPLSLCPFHSSPSPSFPLSFVHRLSLLSPSPSFIAFPFFLPLLPSSPFPSFSFSFLHRLSLLSPSPSFIAFPFFLPLLHSSPFPSFPLSFLHPLSLLSPFPSFIPFPSLLLLLLFHRLLPLPPTLICLQYRLPSQGTSNKSDLLKSGIHVASK